MGKHFLIIIIMALCGALYAFADVAPDSLPLIHESVEPQVYPILSSDSISLVAVDKHKQDSVAVADSTVKKGNIIQRILRYFKDSNKPMTKKYDFSLLGGPYYNSSTKLGLALTLSGFYRPDTSDHVTSPSNVAVYATASTSGFYMVGMKGHHIFPHDTQRIDYDVYFWSNPRYFWGVGYDRGIDMANSSKYDEKFFHSWVNYIVRVCKGLFIGPGIEYKYTHAAKPEHPELWGDQAMHTNTIGLGVKVQYDTRDNFTATQSGLMASVEQKFYPRFLGNKYAFSSTEINFNYYHKLWKGSVIATRLRSIVSYGNVPLVMLPTFGGSYSMRGYYEGRFRDKCEADLTVELRQHVWRRNGIVIWGGVGSVFPKISAFTFRKLLPNYGIGYRWELKHRSNVRVDLGFGKGETGFTFSINEAF